MENLTRPQGEEQCGREKQQGEQQEIHPAAAAIGQYLLQPHREGGGGAPGDGEKRPDGQIQGAGEKICVGTAYLAAEIKEPTAAADTQSSYAQKGQAYAGYQKAYNGRPYVPAGYLSHIYRENQVSGAEEHTKQHTGYVDILLKTQLLFHR